MTDTKLRPGDVVQHSTTGIIALVIRANANNALLDVDGVKRGYPVTELELVASGGGGELPEEVPNADAENVTEASAENVPRPAISLRKNARRGTLPTPDRASNPGCSSLSTVDRRIENSSAVASTVQPKIEPVLAAIPAPGLNRKQLAKRLGLTAGAVDRWHRFGDAVKVALMSGKHDPEGKRWMLSGGKYYPLD